MRVGFLINMHHFDLGWILHFPIAFRVLLNPYILTCSFISTLIIHCPRQVINKRFLTNMAADRPRVERIRCVIRPLVPVQECPCWHLHFPGWEDAPENLNRIAPWNGYGPGPGFVIANWLLYEPSRVQLHGPIQTLQGLYPAHVWKYGLYHVQVMEGYQWCNWMGRKKPKEVAVHVKLFNVKQSKAMSNVGKN